VVGLKQEADPHAANDDPPDPHALDAAATGEAGEDKLELVEQPRKVNSEAISYARVAKKIDVIALKRALSHQITSSSVRHPPRNRFCWQCSHANSLVLGFRHSRKRRKESRSRTSSTSFPLASRTGALWKISPCRHDTTPPHTDTYYLEGTTAFAHEPCAQVCFITLLHLANEHDFEITAASLGGPNDDEDDDDDEDDRDSLAYPTDYLVHVPERQ
jgi:hypothetical protein